MSANTSDILAHFDDDTIAHYGVKGMKWGVRKDRRKGSGRTRKGGDSKKKKKTIRERFAEKASNTSQKKSEKSRGLNEGSSANPDKKEKPVDTNKSPRRMNDEELRRATQRLEAETRFAQAKSRNKRTTTTSGKLAGWMGDTTKDIVTDVTKSTFKKFGNELLAEALGIEPASVKDKKKKK